MKTILAIDLGKNKSVFCRLNTSSLKPEYFTAKTGPQKFHDIFIELDIESSIVLFGLHRRCPVHFLGFPLGLNVEKQL